MTLDVLGQSAARSVGGEAVRARLRVRDLAASKVREVANAGLSRSDVLRFWFGESDQPTPQPIVAAAMSALAQGRTFYAHNLGLPELRDALQAYLEALHGRPIAYDAVSVTSSGVSALMIAMQAILDPGDRVVAVTPVWPNVAEIPRILGAEVVRLPLRPKAERWRLDLDALLDAITPRTRLVLLNSPGNPTGWTLEPEQLAPILEHCRRLGVWLLSDDVYERLVFGSRLSAPSFLSIAEPGDRLISTNSFSKAWLMTGWRLGWITAPPGLQQDLTKLIEYNTSCAPEFVQCAGLAALACGDQPIEALRRSLLARKDQLLTALARLERLEATRPDGGMYVMVRIPGFEDSVALAKRLVEEAGLGLAPGLAFGAESEGWLRWCVAVAPDALAEGVRRLEAWLAADPRPAA
ncbi:MAG TPA: pyridoxal phosphate-dependent aminotransferase [Caulobacteraceae bacterium]|nr:pyridoxal phosphate-dependent aminotransferase [Caulobacteraceae bacterium]